MKTMPERIKEAGITMTCQKWHENPYMPDSENMDHWKCLLKYQRSRMTVYFSMGYGHNGKAPELADVLDCLASDASGFDNSRSFIILPKNWTGE
jgi:hypothetical protein